MNQVDIAVAYHDFAQAADAEALANSLKLPLVNAKAGSHEFLLLYTPERLELLSTKDKTPGPIFVDFTAGKMAYRLQQHGGRDEMIAKAVGMTRSENLTVLDVTAGLGRDAFVLACLGAQVTLLERSPIVAALLKDGLDRARAVPEFKAFKLKLIIDDAIEYISQLDSSHAPDVIYCDPMYPERTKSALPKKEMQTLRHIVGEDVDAQELIAKALSCAKRRVVLKRPRKSQHLIERKPDIVYEGQSSRFDVWLAH